MNILISGASGLIGSALAPFLRARGHRVIPLSRSSGDLRSSGPCWNPDTNQIDLSGIGSLDAVIHLAGENIAGRWTPAKKAGIRDSRVQGTRILSEALARLSSPPKVMVFASATGFYGNRGDEWLDEQSAPGAGFLAEVCREWEAATKPAIEKGIRVVNLRQGMVLTPKGGALAKMLPAFRLGLGGKVGRGQQYWSWIALDDLLAVYEFVLTNESLSGPINVVAVEPVTNREFTRTLGAVLRRPTFFSVPEFAIKLLLGEMGVEALLSSARVKPARLQQAGFVFQFPKLDSALRHLLEK